MEILKKRENNTPIKVVLMDFDGTISTLRKGWEKIMLPMCLEYILSGTPETDELKREVEEYIDASTGIQTIHQMIWLSQRVKSHGKSSEVQDPWWYKREYSKRLQKIVDERISMIKSNEKTGDDYMMKGSKNMLKLLKSKGIPVYIASGSDTEDVANEAEILGVKQYIKDILGGRHGETTCAKEIILNDLIAKTNIPGEAIMVIGDGMVEIEKGNEKGAFTIGIASDEDRRTGINSVKERRLKKADANIIIGDFLEIDDIFKLAGII